MKIALTSPYCWPEVRRGAERFLEDLALHFVRGGHDVTIVSTTLEDSEPPVDWTRADVRRVLFRRRAGAWQVGRLFTPLHRFGAACHRFFRHERFELVYCLNYHDAAAAILAGLTRPRAERPRVIYHAVGIPLAASFRSVPHDRLAFELCTRRAEFMVVSEFARARAQEDFGVDAKVLRPPVAVERFAATTNTRAPEPVFAFVGDVDERRKGALAMARVFSAILAQVPKARLLYCGRASLSRQAEIRAAVPSQVAGRIGFTGVVPLGELPSIYSAASVVALPAVWESFGLVLVEALAAGTPVVGCRHGGIPEIITDPRIGCLFDPGAIGQALEPANDAGLAKALLAAYALSREPQTRNLCAAHARTFCWAALGPCYDAVLECANRL